MVEPQSAFLSLRAMEFAAALDQERADLLLEKPEVSPGVRQIDGSVAGRFRRFCRGDQEQTPVSRGVGNFMGE